MTLQERLRQRAKPIRERLSAPTATDLREPYDSMLTEAADRIDADLALMREALDALECVEALIEHQYTGTREGMAYLQNTCDDAQVMLNKLRARLEGV
jgi:hypothetical protein